MRILYAGSADIAVPALEALDSFCQSQASWGLAGILTSPDAPKGRHGAPTPTPVGLAAEALKHNRGVPLLKPATLNIQAQRAVQALGADLLVSFAYRKLFSPAFLALFPLGGINIHPSLLPKYRGASPIQEAILNQDRETGVSIQTLAPEIDAGDILAQERILLTGDETTETLGDRFAQLAIPLLLETLQGIQSGTIQGKPQDHDQATYCSIIAKEHGMIDWETSAWDLDAKIRAYTPWPLCSAFHGSAKIHILAGKPYEEHEFSGTFSGSFPGNFPGSITSESLETASPGQVLGMDRNRGILVKMGNGIFAATRLQYQARKALGFQDFINGAPGFIGSRLTGRQDGKI